MGTLAIRGGRVLTPAMEVHEADVLIDQEAGSILAVGTDVGTGDETIDATEQLIVPGLVNAHCHVAMTLFRGIADDKQLDRWLSEDIWPLEAELRPADVFAGARLGLLEMIKSGTTAFADMYFHVPQIARAVEEAGIRGVIGHTAITVGKDEAAALADLEESLAVALEYEDAADGRIRTSFQPHALTTVGTEYLDRFVPRAHQAGLPIHFHANETRDEVDPIVEEHGRRPLVYADERGLLTDTSWIAHGVHVDNEEIDLLADRGTGVAHCPASNMKLASGMAPVQQLLDAGVGVGIGTDGAASNNDLDMFDELRDAAMLGKLAADDAAAMDAATTFTAATAGGADLLGLATGRIEPGAPADLAVLALDRPHLTPAHDLLSHLVYAARGADVRHTICAGRVLMRDRTVLSLDERATIRAARRRAETLLARANGSV